MRSSEFGDMYIQTVVETPSNLTRKQRELLQAFDAETSDGNHPESEGFFTRVRDFFDNLSH